MTKLFKPNQVESYTVVISKLSQADSADLTVWAANHNASVVVKPIVKKGCSKMKTKRVINYENLCGWLLYGLGMLMLLARIFAPAPQFVGW